MKKLLLGIILFFTLLPTVNAANYEIDYYDIYIKVNENNTFDISEKITISDKSINGINGIIRTIPLTNEVISEQYHCKNKVSISNITSNLDFITYSQDNELHIKIGNISNKDYWNEDYFEINYLYDIGNDKIKSIDEFYFNIIGTNWDTSINNVTFTIEMPKEFNEELLGFSTGSKDSIGFDDYLSFEVNDNIIFGSYLNKLPAFSGITIRLELDDGYFIYKSIFINEILVFILLISLILICFFVRCINNFKYNTKTMNTHPPKELNITYLNYINTGIINANSINVNILSLANKGYLTIEVFNRKSLFDKKRFKLTKLREYPESDIVEKTFFNGIFSHGKIEDNKQVTYNYDLPYKFYTTIIKISSSFKSNKNEYFAPFNFLNNLISPLINFISIFIIYKISNNSNTLFLSNGYSYIIALHFMILLLISEFKKSITHKNKLKLAFSILFAIIILISNKSFFPYLITNLEYFLLYIFSLIIIISVIFSIPNLIKRTPYAIKFYIKNIEFKNFILSDNFDKLSSLQAENPNYFYENLSYAYSLGILEKYIKKFENINIPSPNWLVNYDNFNPNTFYILISKLMKELDFVSFQQEYIEKNDFFQIKPYSYHSSTSDRSSSSSSSNSGFSNNSRSGRGSGGGGGSSW